MASESSPPELTGAYVPEPAEAPGTRVGPYKLLQKLGEGGMGTVYLAEQEEPVRRRVALKIIKAGMDSAHVLARFEAERQALAMLDHPNIAKVLDAGTTDRRTQTTTLSLWTSIPAQRGRGYPSEARMPRPGDSG